MAGINENEQKASEDSRGNPEKANPTEIERYIHGASFPADKNRLLQQARINQAPQDVINVLNKFEEKQYKSPIDISKELGRVE